MPPRPHDRLRVLLDVSQFGIVQEQRHKAHHRAGIHRVVMHTVRALREAPDVDVALCARERMQATLAFVDEHPELRELPFRIPARKRWGWQLRSRVVDPHDRLGVHPPGALPLRALNRLLFEVNEVLDAWTGPVGLTAFRRADVFHSPVYALPALRDRVRRVRRVRYYLTIYDVIPFRFPEFSSWGGEAWLRHIIERIGPEDNVLAISEHSRRDLLDACPQIAPERVYVTHLAADPERFYPCADPARRAQVRATYGIPDAPYVLSVGTLEPRKNIPHLIRTFAALVRAEQLDDLHLVLTGDRGWDDEAIFAEAGQRPDVRDRIVFTGFVDDADLAPLYTGALVFVYPSFYEGFGLPPLEAMQCGTPVITSNTSSLPEVVGDAGTLVDPRDGDALAQAILEVYRDGEQRAALARRALARARQFTWERFGRQTDCGRVPCGPLSSSVCAA